MLQISWRLMNLSCIKVRPYRCPMKDENSLGRLKELENESAAIRHQLGISSPREVIYQASINPVDEETVVVEADGFGAATLKIQTESGPLTTDTVKYVVVWKRRASGPWQLAADIWNSNS